MKTIFDPRLSTPAKSLPNFLSQSEQGLGAGSPMSPRRSFAQGAHSCRSVEGQIPSLPGFGLLGFCRSAGAVGGDFYDVLPASGQSALLVVADVMGKGAPAAQVAARLRTELRILAFQTVRPARLLGLINQLMFDELSGSDVFITAQLALVEARERRLTLASAGHCPLLLSSGDGEVRGLSPEGMPLGILPEQDFAEQVAPLGPSCCALLYTDGFSEARSSSGEFFGEGRLRNWLGRSAGREQSAQQLSRSFLAEIQRFQSRAMPQDDQTFLLLAEQTDVASLISANPVARLPAYSGSVARVLGRAAPQVAMNG
jgi:serine phosphatase RsbU (regulator of sigma subunit)